MVLRGVLLRLNMPATPARCVRPGDFAAAPVHPGADERGYNLSVMRYRVVQHGERQYLLVQGAWDSKLLEVIDRFRLTELHFQDFSREGPVHIDFLRELPFLQPSLVSNT
jgi:hypothetical protein